MKQQVFVEEPLQLNTGLEHVNGVAARPAARATGAKSTKGNKTLEIGEVIVAPDFSTKEKRGRVREKEENICFYFIQRGFISAIVTVDIAFFLHLT